MTEAFEIGVSLALQDGVSDAIGKARRDVAALEHAVRESGVSLRSLRDVGARSASVAFGDTRREPAAGPARRVVPEVAALPQVEMTAPARLETESQSPAARDSPARQLAESGAHADASGEAVPLTRIERVETPVPAAAAREAEPFAQKIPDMRPRAPARLDEAFVEAATGAAQEGSQARLDELRQVVAPVRGEEARLAEGGAAGHPSGVAEGAAPGRALDAEPLTRPGVVPWPAQPVAAPMWGGAVGADMPPLADAAGVRGEDGPGARGQMTLLSALRLSGGSAAMTQSDDPATIVVDGSARSDGAGPENAQPASVSAAAAPRFAPLISAAPTSAQGQSAPAHADSHEAAPREGDVFLDGMLVGRWMSRFLNREAERASAGPTGFDARRGRLLPGVTVGG